MSLYSCFVHVSGVRIQARTACRAGHSRSRVSVVHRLDVFGFHSVEDLHEAAQVVEGQTGLGLRRLTLGQNAVGNGDAGAEDDAGRKGQKDTRGG